MDIAKTWGSMRAHSGDAPHAGAHLDAAAQTFEELLGIGDAVVTRGVAVCHFPLKAVESSECVGAGLLL